MSHKSIAVLAVALLTIVAGCASTSSWNKDGVAPDGATNALSECKYQVGLNKIADDKQKELIADCMQSKPIEISLSDAINTEEVVDLYKANQWSSAEKPDELLAALRNSHSLVTARRAGKLIGIGNAISDGHDPRLPAHRTPP